MYSVTKFQDRHMMAFSVPPYAHADLHKDFQELSRIHFYLGHHPIDFMIKAVEDASLEDIEKGKTQIYFATKEIQEFLSSSWSNIDAFSKNSLDTSLYFQKTFDNTLSHALEVLEYAFKKPTKKNNIDKIEVMLGLTHEVAFLSKQLAKIGIVTNTDKIAKVETQYAKIYNLKSHYDNLFSLKDFNDYLENAQNSVVSQLKIPYEFNYSEMAKKVYFDMCDWMSTLRFLSDEKEKMNQSDYVFQTDTSQELKDDFLKQIKSFNQILNNGVVNYVHSFSASISKEAFITVQKSQISAQDYFDRAIGYHKEALNRGYSCKDYDQKEIKRLEDTKEDFIATKIDDKAFYEKYLTVLYRQEHNINNAFDKIRANLFNITLKDTVTFEGDINYGFVVGTFSTTDKVLLIHKDSFVNVPEAVYAMIITKEKYDNLVQKEELLFTKDFRESEFSNASNFWSYGQLLQEITDPSIQKFFLGKEFDLIDNTVLNLKDSKKKPKI